MQLFHTPVQKVAVAMDVFWKLVKGELRQQLMSYAEDFKGPIQCPFYHKLI